LLRGSTCFAPPFDTPTSAGASTALADHVAGLHDLDDRADARTGRALDMPLDSDPTFSPEGSELLTPFFSSY